MHFDPLAQPAKSQHDGEGAQPNCQGLHVDRRRLRHREIKARQEMLIRLTLRRQAQKVFELIEKQEHRRPQREADDDGVGDIARQIAQSQ